MRFLFIVSVWIFSLPLFAQQPVVDSLWEIIRQNRGDAQSFAAYKKLAETYEKQEPSKAILYYRNALKFPFRTTYAKDFVSICNLLAELYHLQGQYDSSLLLNRRALNLAKNISIELEVAKAYQGIGLTYLRTLKIDSARTYFQIALDLFIKLKDPTREAGVYVNLGNVFLEETNYKESLNQFIKAASLFEGAAHDSTGLARAWLNIANIENILTHYDKALDYISRGLKIAERKKNDAFIAYCHNLSGRIFRKQSKLDQALQEYEQAITIYRQRGDVRNESEVVFAEGNIFSDMNQFERAIGNYRKSLRLSKKINNNAQLAFAYSAMGQAFFSLKKYPLASAYIDSSLTYAQRTKNQYLELDAYNTKSELFKAQKNFDKALFFREKYSALKDTITRHENQAATEELEVKYQNTKKQAEIELLRKDRELKNISLKQSRTVQVALAATVILLVIIGLLTFSRNKTINEAKRQMEIERMRDQIARDLHDDIGSTLSSINLISQVAQNESAANEADKKYFRQIADQSAKMMESMSDMVWSIDPENDTLQKTIVKMKEFSAEILEPKNITYHFLVNDNVSDPTLDIAKRKNLFLVFKEGINNAAKYSECSSIFIQFAQEENNLRMTLQDNGKGFDLANAANGNGLKNMKERALEIGADFNIQSTPQKGTLLTLSLPLT